MDKQRISDLINSLEWLRDDIIGRNIMVPTPYGERPLIYADYTASGRGLKSIELHIQSILQFYANSHTEDDFTGTAMTTLLHDAEKIIKRCVNAGEKGKIIFTESGATGGIAKLLQILGVYWPPATRRRMDGILKSCLTRNPDGIDCNQALFDYMHNFKPIVFVGPYEHHSNEIMWRQTLCEIMEIPLNAEQKLDLEKLEELVSDPRHANRLKIGSFSAASNVSGLKTPVYEVARILHRHGALACFDFAACAPYVPIDMNRDSESYFDAIFLSPHKFLGGPGTSGILVFNSDIYPLDLPPTVAAGGTVDYVSPLKEGYVHDIETREKPGTPGIMQALRIAMVFQIKEKVGLDNIDILETYFYKRFMAAFENDPRITFYGPQDASDKISIIPFNIHHQDRILHPKFVTSLISDLFGIQTRAGCSCAGPYGHYLMNIEQSTSEFYFHWITSKGYTGIKPGWVRLNVHYSMNDAEVDYLITAVKFMLKYGYKFLSCYEFDLRLGSWNRIGHQAGKPLELDIEAAYAGKLPQGKAPEDIQQVFAANLQEAERLAKTLPEDFELLRFEPELEALMFFYTHRMKAL